MSVLVASIGAGRCGCVRCLMGLVDAAGLHQG
jgi:hypothetical protein